jgi:hypothetical protein
MMNIDAVMFYNSSIIYQYIVYDLIIHPDAFIEGGLRQSLSGTEGVDNLHPGSPDRRKEATRETHKQGKTQTD